ncbi:hypothetical protein ANCCEY_02493 [Ancylostoma ceylanicum]|uniref:SXP/RAL-2 family protein Ani s 5-like cation-binding domain-containing protein n=2 Tax=Ancylostoma ceylanicum TaxID=53326 RepID=A0A8I3B3Q0_9BILA|nr:hypothetical protein ANCCEY_02493 [Ancylostoma ceylanicum]EYC01568.1 hypothetical protein Y032_0106g3761 [Ancylostoma ceylanicum]
MMKTVIVLLMILAVVVCQQRWWEREIKDIPGVSAENMAKLRQIMTPRPTSREEFKQKITEWKNGLPEAEKAAAEAHRQKMRELHHKNHPHPHPHHP